MGVIRQATVTDCTSLTKCNKACLPMVYLPMDYFVFITSKDYEVVVIESKTNKKNKVIGYLLGSYDFETKNVHIMSIGILDIYRKKGLGTQLLGLFEQIVDRRGITSVSLFVHVINQVAISFYERNGFSIQETMKDYYVGCLTDVSTYDGHKMVKPIVLQKKEVMSKQS